MTVAKSKEDFDGIISMNNKYLKKIKSESEKREGFLSTKL